MVTFGSPNDPFTEHFYVLKKFIIDQRNKGHSPFIFIGIPPRIPPPKYPNPIKTVLQYSQMLDDGQAQTQADLARLLGISRAKVTQMLNVLKLAEEIQDSVEGDRMALGQPDSASLFFIPERIGFYYAVLSLRPNLPK